MDCLHSVLHFTIICCNCQFTLLVDNNLTIIILRYGCFNILILNALTEAALQTVLNFVFLVYIVLHWVGVLKVVMLTVASHETTLPHEEAVAHGIIWCPLILGGYVNKIKKFLDVSRILFPTKKCRCLFFFLLLEGFIQKEFADLASVNVFEIALRNKITYLEDKLKSQRFVHQFFHSS